MKYFEVFARYLTKQPLAKTTRRQYLADTQQFLRWFEEAFAQQFSADEVTQEQVTRYTQRPGVSKRTRERQCSSLRKFFTALQKQGIIMNTPFFRQISKQHEDRWNLTEFTASLRRSNMSDLTRKHYLLDIKQFCQWAEKKGARGNIADRYVGEYMLYLLSDLGYAKTTIQRKCSALRKYSLWLRENRASLIPDHR